VLQCHHLLIKIREVLPLKNLPFLILTAFLLACGGKGGGGGGDGGGPSHPTVATHPATSVTETGAQLNGNVNPNGLATDAWFEWGTSPTLETFATIAVQSIGGGIVSVAINYNLNGLTAGQTYYFRAAAANSIGTDKGVIASIRAKSVRWAVPQYFTDNTPLVPFRDLQGYEIYIKRDPSFRPGDSPVATASAMDTTYTLENDSPPLLNGVTYYVSLRTVTTEGVKSDFSPAVSFSLP
jgi:hypothetical protein